MASLEGNLRERTKDDYKLKLSRVEPHIGKRRIADITDRDIRALVSELAKTYRPHTVKNTLVPVSGVFQYAIRHGWAGQNPVLALERDDLPKSDEREQRILSREEIGKLLAAASSDRYRVLLATATFTGLRLMELLGLRWGEVDFEEGVIRVREQLSRTAGEGRIPLKTKKAKRDVVLMPALAKMLREYRASTIYKDAGDYVFTTGSGSLSAGRTSSVEGFTRRPSEPSSGSPVPASTISGTPLPRS
jgi:integrase